MDIKTKLFYDFLYLHLNLRNVLAVILKKNSQHPLITIDSKNLKPPTEISRLKELCKNNTFYKRTK